jgi:kinesin family protein 5
MASTVRVSRNTNLPVRSKAPSSSRRSLTPTSRTHDHQQETARVRVAVRLRPRNAHDLLSDVDSTDFVQLNPELNRIKLRKNNWNSESYRFDQVFTETASQKRVYDAVAKPVVESVLSGYNGTIMAYGQTGTGKTYTLGGMGTDDDASQRGIMLRSLQEILAQTSPISDTVEISYLQLYMESVQDLLAPEKINIPIFDDSKTGEVSVPGAVVVKIQHLDHFLQILQVGETNRHAANTKLNTESSRSHAILIVYVKRHGREKEETDMGDKEDSSGFSTDNGRIPTVRKSKLLIVDLAGSERLDKSGSEGHMAEETKFINLSLTSLGKCINALAENSPHIPTRDSKLTRLLRDSFGGSARTSLIITIGPSSQHHAETTSTIMFGQRAMKVVNMVKLKEEFDYESLCKKLENQVDQLSCEIDRHQKLRVNEKIVMERKLKECQNSFADKENILVARCEFLEKENTRLEEKMKDIMIQLNYQKQRNDVISDEVARLEISVKRGEFMENENTRLQSEMKDMVKKLNCQKEKNELMHEELSHFELNLNLSKQYQSESGRYQKVLADTTQMYEKKIADLMKALDDERAEREGAEEQVDVMKKILNDHEKTMQEQHQIDESTYHNTLAYTTGMYEKKIAELLEQLEVEHTHSQTAEEELVLANKQINHYQNLVQNHDQNEMDEHRRKLQEVSKLHEANINELKLLKSNNIELMLEKEQLNGELDCLRQTVLVEERRRKGIESELLNLKKVAPESEDGFEDKRSYMKDNSTKGSSPFASLHKSTHSKETISGQRATIAKICEEVGLHKILALLKSEEIDVQIHAVKVVANLAAEDMNQEKIVEEGGLDALLLLLRSSQNTTILRAASGAIANLAMNEMNQGLIMSKGGGRLLASTVHRTDDPQTLRMVAGAIANLCGNETLHVMLREEGGIKALLGMVRCGNTEVIAQVARGIANFAKCESRAVIQGNREGRSLLMDDGALSWLISNSTTASTSTRRHIELALCHLAQNEENTRDFISSRGVRELSRISVESTREDIRNLAKKTIKLNPTFRDEIPAQ